MEYSHGWISRQSVINHVFLATAGQDAWKSILAMSIYNRNLHVIWRNEREAACITPPESAKPAIPFTLIVSGVATGH